MRPDELQIGPMRWGIDWSKSATDHGACDFESNMLVIQDSLSDQNQRATLMHEVLHAIIDVYAPSRDELPRKAKLVARDEMYVGALEVGLLQFIEDEPEAWGWICSWDVTVHA